MPQGVSIFLLLNWRGVSIMPTIDMTATGTNIKNLIKQKGMTIADVQKILNSVSFGQEMHLIWL